MSEQAAVTMVSAVAKANRRCRWLAFAADHYADRREARTSRTLIVIERYSADGHVVASAMKDFAMLWILATTGSIRSPLQRAGDPMCAGARARHHNPHFTSLEDAVPISRGQRCTATNLPENYGLPAMLI